jgi:hypothetical protein
MKREDQAAYDDCERQKELQGQPPRPLQQPTQRAAQRHTSEAFSALQARMRRVNMLLRLETAPLMMRSTVVRVAQAA